MTQKNLNHKEDSSLLFRSFLALKKPMLTKQFSVNVVELAL